MKTVYNFKYLIHKKLEKLFLIIILVWKFVKKEENSFLNRAYIISNRTAITDKRIGICDRYQIMIFVDNKLMPRYDYYVA